LERAYQDIPAVDLSREVFAPQPHRLLAICEAKSGWTDLGSPARVLEILGRRNTHPTWWPEGRESVFLSANSNRDHASRDDSGQDVTGARYRARESLNNDRQKRSI
jgi:hypothetical protein